MSLDWDLFGLEFTTTRIYEGYTAAQDFCPVSPRHFLGSFGNGRSKVGEINMGFESYSKL